MSFNNTAHLYIEKRINIRYISYMYTLLAAELHSTGKGPSGQGAAFRVLWGAAERDDPHGQNML